MKMWGRKPDPKVGMTEMLNAVAPRGSVPIANRDDGPSIPPDARKIIPPQPKCLHPECDDRAKGGKSYCCREHAIAHRELDRARRLRGAA